MVPVNLKRGLDGGEQPHRGRVRLSLLQERTVGAHQQDQRVLSN
jgi:hypothetical protein